MAKERCKETKVNSSFGNFLYEQKVAKDHFLRKLNEVVDWDRFTKKPLGYYQGKGGIGQRHAIPPSFLRCFFFLICGTPQRG